MFILIFGIWVPHLFLTADTVRSVASQQAIAAMLGLAVLVPLAAGTYDLSVGATVNLAAVLVSLLQSDHHWNMWPAIGVTVLATAAVGAISGFIVVKLRVNSFIATLGMATVVTAVQEIISGQTQPLPPVSSAWNELTQYQILGFQVVFLYLIVMALVCWWALEHTPAGRYIYATGGNPEAARLSGVKTGKWTAWSLVTAATLSGIAGVF